MSRSWATMVELPGWSVVAHARQTDSLTFYFGAKGGERLLGHRIRIVFVYAQVNILGPQQIDQLEHLFAPCARCQVALFLSQRRGDEDLFVVRVCASSVDGLFAQLFVVSRPDGVTRKENAGNQHKENENVGHRKDSPVDEAQDGSFAATRGDVVGVDGTFRELVDAAEARGEAGAP